MKNYIGIDLGTTNSVICAYDGLNTTIYKSIEQNDVTPSAIYIDKRGNKYLGKRAYDAGPFDPDNSATLFKRFMGTNNKIKFRACNITKTPEECSAEILRMLFSYLPEDIQQESDIGTVITVPAAFNQMQKDATMQAANLAGIGRVALMQEPVAAVMKVMKTSNEDGLFLIYDLGGGTLDIAIAESLGGSVNLLAHGGIAMCGGRDFDRILFDNVVRPWLLEHFDLPKDFSVNPSYKSLARIAVWATERAKIDLSRCDESMISLSESELRCRDLSGEEIYIDISLKRDVYNHLISDNLNETIEAARETLQKCGLSPHDVSRIVFIGGPTNYKPLREKISFELGIKGSIDVNPMTAVAEGASMFAESIDWSSQDRSRKTSRGEIRTSGGSVELSLKFMARTSSQHTKIFVQEINGQFDATSEFQIDSLETGWTSGRLTLAKGASVSVDLPKMGENVFKLSAFNGSGQRITLEKNKICITRTAVTIDAIPASHSIGVEVLTKRGGPAVLDYLVRAGDSLPHKGKKIFRSGETLTAGSSHSLNFKLWEGDIENPITDNRPIGVLKISGNDFDSGEIPTGADLECSYEILDSGNIILEISVPCIAGVFKSNKNFYSRQEGQRDFSNEMDDVVEEADNITELIDKIEEKIIDSRLDQVRDKIDDIRLLEDDDCTDMETTQEAMEKIYAAKKILAQVRQDHLKEIRQLDLDSVINTFNDYVKKEARPIEITSFNNLINTAKRDIECNSELFENHLNEMHQRIGEILWRQPSFIIAAFQQMTANPHHYYDMHLFSKLVKQGNEARQANDTEELKSICYRLMQIKIGFNSADDMLDVVNIIKNY